MNIRTMLIFLVVFFGGCYSTHHFHSEDTVQIEHQQISESMRILSDEMKNISQILATEQKDDIARNQLNSHLNTMLALTEDLGAGKFILNHELLEQNIHQLRADLQSAQDGLVANPPSYYWVSRIPQYCSNCHSISQE